MLTKAWEGKLIVAAKPQSNYYDSAYGGGSNASLGMDVAFAPMSHLGLIGSYRSVHNRRIDENVSPIFADVYGGVFNGNRWELGAGYFNTFGRKGRFEAYGGYGQGTLSRRGYYTPDRDFSTRYHRIFLQSALGLGNDLFASGGGLRIASQQFFDFQPSNNPSLRYEILNNQHNTDVQSVHFVFIEPFINAELGWKLIRFTAQVGITLQVSGDNIAGNTPLYGSLGACFHVDPDYFRPGGLSGKLRPRRIR
ncbi:MAG: hypothetical protein JST06_02340 [Bacteroidetes bacterium]|nr:hypothetical protein [Bacteroidota bacterium]